MNSVQWHSLLFQMLGGCCPATALNHGGGWVFLNDGPAQGFIHGFVGKNHGIIVGLVIGEHGFGCG